MNWVDWIILAILAISVVGGIARGALRTVFSLAGIVAGFFVASRESGAVGMVLSRWMPENAAAAAGFVFVFLGIAVAFTLASWLLRKILAGLFLGWIDRVLGAGLGFLRAAVALGVLALVIEGLGSFPEARRSVTYPYAVEAGRTLLRLIPRDTLERLDWDELKEKMPRLRELTEEAEKLI